MRHQLLILLLAFIWSGCQNDDLALPEQLDCEDPLGAEALQHPSSDRLEAAMQEAIRKGFPGVNASIINADGIWVGAAGYSDLMSGTLMQTCQPMMVASVTKMFTATIIYLLAEQNLIAMDDKLSDHLEGVYMEKIRNAQKVTIRQLLNHTSGLYDYLDPIAFEFISINKPYNSQTPEEKLKLAYGKKPTHEPGETYAYSNTNFVLLELLITSKTNQSFKAVMQQYLFDPLGLASGFMGDVDAPIPVDAPKGYLSIHANDDLIDSEFYYHYDLATGDGGVAITMYDLNEFMRALHAGVIISTASLEDMKSAIELPEDWKGFFHESNGQGLEIYETPYGTAYGHLGGIVGFTSVAWYFPGAHIAVSYSVNGVSPLINSYTEDFALAITKIAFENQ